MTLPFPDSPAMGENIADSITQIEQNLEFLDGNLTTRSSKVHTETRDMEGASGDVNYPVSDITAKGVIIIASEPDADATSWGFIDEDGLEYCVYVDYDGNFIVDTSAAVHLITSVGTAQVATWKAFNDGSLDLTWVKTGSPSAGTATLLFLLLA